MGIATITEWDLEGHSPVRDGVALTADFDPKNLRLTYSPTGVTGADTATKTGSWSKFPAQQTGHSTTLSIDLTFDTTDTGDSVQAKTDQLVWLTFPETAKTRGKGRRVVLFSWGSFLFYGTVQNLGQTIEYFSETGVPLRASVALTLSDMKPPDPASARPATPPVSVFGTNPVTTATASTNSSASSPAGTTPLTLSQSGDSVQSIAARSGGGVSWKTIAAANGIDNPRLIPPGTVLDLNARLG